MITAWERRTSTVMVVRTAVQPRRRPKHKPQSTLAAGASQSLAYFDLSTLGQRVVRLNQLDEQAAEQIVASVQPGLKLFVCMHAVYRQCTRTRKPQWNLQ